MTHEEKKVWNRAYWEKRKARSNALKRTKYFRENFEKIQARMAAKTLESEMVARVSKHPTQKVNPKSDSQKQALVRALKELPCQDCDNHFHPWVIEFDHRIPEEKEFPIARSFHNGNVSLARLKQELAKCDHLCANCHRVRTARRRAGLPATLPPPEYHI